MPIPTTTRRQIARSMVASLAGRIIGVLHGLLLIPLLYRYLDSEAVGFWFLIAQPLILIGLFDLGITPTATRAIAMAADSPKRLAAIGGTIGRLFFGQACLVMFLWTIVGTFVVRGVGFRDISSTYALMVWATAGFSYALTIWSNQWTCHICGTGQVPRYLGITAIARGLGLLMKIAALLLGQGLLAIALVDLCIAVGSLMALRQASKVDLAKIDSLFARSWSTKVFNELRPLAVRSWCTSLGAFLVLQTDQYFIAFHSGIEQIPDYQATLMVFAQVYSLANIAIVSSSVYISQAWSRNAFVEVRRLVSLNADLVMTVATTGALTIILVCRPLFDLWLGPGHFVGYPVLCIFAATMLLEVHHVIFASAAMSTGDEAFAKPALAAGGLNLLFTSVLIGPFGLVGVAGSTLLAQLLTNNWYGVYRGHRRIQSRIVEHLQRRLLPLCGVGILMLLPLSVVIVDSSIVDSPLFAIASVMWCAAMGAVYLRFIGRLPHFASITTTLRVGLRSRWANRLETRVTSSTELTN